MSLRATALLSVLRLLVGGIVGLLAIDMGVGWLDRARVDDEPSVLVEDWQLGWTNRPNYVGERATTDDLGLRNPLIPADAPGDEVRLLVLGDSRVFGSGVTDAEVFTVGLERELGRDGTAVRVLNGGVNSYSTLQASQRAVQLIPQVQPDLIIIFVSPGWTLRPNTRAGDWELVGERLVPADIVEAWPQALRPLPATIHRLMSHSHLYARHRAAFRKGGKLAPRIAHFVLSHAEPGPDVRPFVDNTVAALLALQHAAEQARCEVLAALLPETFQINRAVWERYLADHAAAGAPPIGTDPLEPMVALQALVEQTGIRAWPFYQEVATFMRDVDRYYQVDEAHWTADGHGAFATTLAERLRDTGTLSDLVTSRAGRVR